MPTCSTVVYQGQADLVTQVERDGYFVLHNFLDTKAVLAARQEMSALLDQDIEAREAANQNKATWLHEGHRTSLTRLMHTYLYPSYRSPLFQQLVNDILSAPLIEDFMHYLVGDNFRLRVDLIRRASGKNDKLDNFQIPHVWHRDTPGEFTFGIFFDDMYERGSGCTAVIKGTHWNPRDPRWDLMLSTKEAYPSKEYFTNSAITRIPEKFARFRFFNRIVANQCKNAVVEMNGGIGGIYMFLNDTWHGRAHNTTGKQFMLARFGGFATDFPFKDDLPLPGDMTTLPGPLGEYYSAMQPANADKNSLMNRLQGRTSHNMVQKLAVLEKRLITRTVIASGLTRPKKAKEPHLEKAY